MLLIDAVNVVHLGEYEKSYCLNCQKECTFSLVLQYEWGNVNGKWGFVKKKEYWKTCDICHNELSLDTKEVEQKLGRVPIPVLHRFGCLILLLEILAIIGVTVLLIVFFPKGL
jgi:hypothetical protein